MKRTVTVTIEKEIEVEFMPSMFGGMTEKEYLAEFRASLWHVETLDDVAKYAASLAAQGSIGYEEDGLGLIGEWYSTYPRVPDTKVRILSEDVEAELKPTPPTEDKP